MSFQSSAVRRAAFNNSDLAIVRWDMITREIISAAPATERD